jgi:hypothetical protein
VATRFQIQGEEEPTEVVDFFLRIEDDQLQLCAQARGTADEDGGSLLILMTFAPDKAIELWPSVQLPGVETDAEGYCLIEQS